MTELGPRAMTPHLIDVVEYLLTKPKVGQYAYAIAEAIDMSQGTVRPILLKLEEAGWLTAEWEPHGSGKPPRRYYRIAPDALKTVRQMVRGARRAR